MPKLTEEDKLLIRQAAEEDLETFVKLVAPNEMWGTVHSELFQWWQRQDAKENQLVLLPRDHKKSRAVAFRVAWWITKYPETTVLYVSATADLAEKQLGYIKNILTSDKYRFYWPDMVNKEEAKRTKWTNDEICVDHGKRKEEGVRDPTVKAVGLTANTTGLHCNVAVLDDVVVPGNAYSETGREQVRSFYSQLSSIESTGAREWVVGTRYHPADLYKDLMDMQEILVDDEGEDVEYPVYETFERVVEKDGEFLWPKMRRSDGKTFGFDAKELARKKAKYLDVTQFYAQYYNNPNNRENYLVDSNKFQYYNRENVSNVSGMWFVGDKTVNVFASMDFAFSTSNTSDYTVIMLVGIDEDNNYYVLEIDRFKTNKISVMYDHVEKLYRKWRFRKIRCEVVAAQKLIVQQFKEYMRGQSIVFAIDEYYPPRNMNKKERIAATLEPRYQNNRIWHYRGGNCQLLEEELLLENPEHDDIKDALAACVEICKPPLQARTQWKRSGNVYHSKFGGVARGLMQ